MLLGARGRRRLPQCARAGGARAAGLRGRDDRRGPGVAGGARPVVGAASPVEFARAGWDECAAALQALVDVLSRPDDGADPCQGAGEGWIAEEALATGLQCAVRHADDPVAALVRAARTSGDSDSIAALAGAFAGAAHGMSGWPQDWVDRIEYADQLAALTGFPIR
ncbi:ADP-ribosylation/Crystallin J1 [Actinosynnema pretiosum subsp. pretiosum]|nr:ADP-ribosylation/Crystallin J1 [Actinosynnema pretiosum subsp. pretiosum]